jgi:dimethylamine/trimethylamine dehydrogenase
MTRDPRYDILFEAVAIGPVKAKNRFFQVPHCNGMGWTQPQALAALRRVKAEGGWAVVSTEEVEIHPTSDCEPFHEGRLWSDADIPALAAMADAVHEHPIAQFSRAGNKAETLKHYQCVFLSAVPPRVLREGTA